MYSVPAGWRGKRWVETFFFFFLTQTRTESRWKTKAANRRMQGKFEDHFDGFCLYFHFSLARCRLFFFFCLICDSSYILSLSSSLFLLTLASTQTHILVIYRWLKEQLGPWNSSLNLIHLSILIKTKIYFTLSFLCLHCGRQSFTDTHSRMTNFHWFWSPSAPHRPLP